VRRVEQPSPRIRRVVLGGGDLARFTWPGPASHLKLVLPLPGQTSPDLPTPDADGLVAFDRSRVIMRTYTPRAWDAQAGELTIDVFVHGEGPASAWAERAQPGDGVAVSRPRARYDAEETAPWLVLAGDESAVPAIGTILEGGSLPASTAVVIESDGDDDLGLPGGTTPTFIRRTESPLAALAGALADGALPGGEGRVWVAGEARGIRRIRAHLLSERGLPASSVVTRGYWRQGEADHPDHDFGDD
jgi:NADPH-dependent ferric siderophore reductase